VARYENRTDGILSAHSVCFLHTKRNDLIKVWFIRSHFPSPCGWCGLENVCLILSNLHNSAINLLRKDDPPLVTMLCIVPYLQIISLYKIWATSSAEVVLVGNASGQSVELSITIRICLYYFAV